MTNKDQILLEEAYLKILKEEEEQLPKIPSDGYADGGEPYTDEELQETEEEKKESDEELLKDIAAIENLPKIGWSTSMFLKGLKDEAKRRGLLKNGVNPSNVTSDMTYSKKGEYVESFVHGIQPISEAKKKINPWAVEKSVKKKMEAKGKKVGPKKEEEIVKGIKKTAKKYGKKITSDKVKKK